LEIDIDGKARFGQRPRFDIVANLTCVSALLLGKKSPETILVGNSLLSKLDRQENVPMRTQLSSIVSTALVLAVSLTANGAIVFSNNFETDAAGFTASGTLTMLTRASLPTDSGGPTSANQSMWLGKLGFNVGKTGATDEIVTLPLSNLVPGQNYLVSFDLLVGASWDGAAGGYGPDSWRFSVNGGRLVDTIFSNVQSGVDAGAYSPQRYTDTNYASPAGADVVRFTGADASFWHFPAYADHYAIYYFGHGAGNPVLSFQATASSATLEFARYGNTSDSGDEYWALDNVTVTGALGAVPGDFDSDGDVDGADFVAWQTNFPYSPGPGIASVPEPATACLALLALLLGAALHCHSPVAKAAGPR
jgi:hypothetical protein